MKKIIYTILMLCICASAKAGDNKTVTLITSGQGRTQDIAKQNALRNAIEQAFGAFISSHSEVVNDNLVKDEIISVSNGNIQKYEVISESLLPDNMGYNTTLKSVVSISKLTSFCESKGMKIEIQGSLFAFNVIQKELSASNEKKALEELVLIAKEIAPKMFDYTIKANEPIKNEISNNYSNRNNQNMNQYCLPIKVNIIINKNWEEYYKTMVKTLSSLALTKSELEDYKKLNISFYSFDIFTNDKSYIGKYKFYSDPNASDGDFWNNGSAISEEIYDDIVWKEIRIEQSSASAPNSGYRNEYPIIASGFEYNNYNINNLDFRTNIKTALYSIFEIINKEAFNFKIQSEISNEITSNVFKVLFSPISDNGRRYDRWELNYKSISYKYSDFTVYDNFSANHRKMILNEKSLFIQQIKPGSIVGFGYAVPMFDLNQIKQLNKLEIKHK